MKAWMHLDKLGIVGSILTALCCLGISAVVSLVTAVGLGFLLKDEILLPALIGFLILTLTGLGIGWKRHGKPWAFVLGLISGAVLLVFSFFSPLAIAAFIAIAGLVGASILNIILAIPRRTSIVV